MRAEDRTEAIRRRMTPEDCDQAQVQMLKIHAAHRSPKGTRRRSDGTGPVKRYDLQGRRIR